MPDLDGYLAEAEWQVANHRRAGHAVQLPAIRLAFPARGGVNRIIAIESSSPAKSKLEGVKPAPHKPRDPTRWTMSRIAIRPLSA